MQRTLLELLNQLDGFSSSGDVRVIAATNRVDRPGCAEVRPTGEEDRVPDPDEAARALIMHIHSRKTNYRSREVNFEELARCTFGFSARRSASKLAW